MKSMKHLLSFRVLFLAGLILTFGLTASAEWKEQVLYSFQGGSDGSTPAGGVVFDKAGKLYGVTNAGGSTCASPGCGVIFQLSPETGGKWKETILYGFNGTQGSVPVGGAIIDSQGNLYGTTAYGGSGQCKLFGYVVGCGVVYELSPPGEKGGQWTYAVLYNFQGGKDGLFPWGDLTLDKAGNLYGATQFGGGKGTSCNPYFDGNCGTVFKVSPPKTKGGKWTETILHSFAGIASGKQQGDGANPNGGLILDGKGGVYGTTFEGGYAATECGDIGCGTVFDLEPQGRGRPWAEKTLYRFHGGDGASPSAGVVLGKNGKLYGTVSAGAISGNGAVFDLTAPIGGGTPWKQRLLYRFRDQNDDSSPAAPLLFDSRGNLYGTATYGGPTGGNVFLMTPTGGSGGWKFNVLHGFTGPPSDGLRPGAGLTLGSGGGLYGTTQGGGSGDGCQGGCGTVFEIRGAGPPFPSISEVPQLWLPHPSRGSKGGRQGTPVGTI